SSSLPNLLILMNISVKYRMICFVIAEPPSFVEELKALEVVKGSTAVFACKVAGSAPFKVTWIKDGKPIKSSQKYLIDSENVSLNIQDCKVEDVGAYQCVVANDVGSCTGFQLWVLWLPWSAKWPVHFHCRLNGAKGNKRSPTAPNINLCMLKTVCHWSYS
uniref:Ig-like domain-containing protein n=1 Tax=Sparus aurata TaxID=8175 RepID=A0A671TMN9_SPAAU